ncbi:MAG TPA: SRPBCC domain-containing protein [Streptosporangiaceae bacterium]|nr:SRPBCC domain-containing protein [Streptosporangiaceae bacterium]
MKTDIDATVVYPHPPSQVWAALTSSDGLAAWLMPNDFAPEVGRPFTLRTKPAPGFDGIVRCQVLELDPPSRMVWSWRGGNIDTTVTFTLTPAGSGTRLRMHQVGFHGLGAQLTRRILAGGYPRILGERLPAYLDQQAGASTGPTSVICAEGWRAYFNIVRRWRPTR